MANDTIIGIFGGQENAWLAEKLRSRGIKCVELPGIRFEYIAPGVHESGVLRDAAAFDWIIFSDAVSPAFFVRACAEFKLDTALLDDVRICSLSDRIALILREFHIHSDLIPWGIAPNDISEAIESYEGNDIGKLRILTVSGDAASADLAAKLRADGADVTELSLYRTVFDGDAAKARAMLIGGAVDHVLISRSDDIARLDLLLPDGPDFELLAYDDEIREELRQAGITAEPLASVTGENLVQ